MDPLHFNWTTLLAIAAYVALNPPVRAAIAWAGSIVAPVVTRIPIRKMATPLAIAVILGVLLANAPLAAQMRRGRTGTGGTSASGADPALAGLVATFEGTIRAVGKKSLSVELTNGNTVEFRMTKKTEVLDGTKAIQLKELQVEAFVKVEGVKDGFGYITANKVTLPPPVAPAPADSKIQN